MERKYLYIKTLVLAILASFQVAFAAEESDITLLTFNHGNAVSLRWAPKNADVFKRSLKSGYVVQRRASGSGAWKSISETLRPMNEEYFAVLEAEFEEAAAVREMFYPSEREDIQDDTDYSKHGKLSSIPGETPFEDDMLHVMALFACDLSIDIAKAAAVYFVDQKIDPKAVYEYRVIFADDANKSKVNVDVVEVNMSKLSVLPTTEEFTGAFDERFAHFEWSVAPFIGYYSAYNIERSTDGKHFVPLRKRPFVQAYTSEALSDIAAFRDTFPNDETTYYYRLRGYSPFGMYGPYSNVVKGQPKFNFDAMPLDVDTVLLEKNSEEIRWSMDKKYEKKIKGFMISRTPDFKTFFYENKTLLPPSRRSFKINKQYEKTQYYAVIAYGMKERQEKQSSYKMSFRSDTIPPAVPTGLKGVVDSAGVVTLTWDANKEPDVVGYQVFLSNSGRDDQYFNAIDTIYPFTTFTDTLNLNTLTNTIYYRVNAVDKSFNRSQWSAPIMLSKPDTIAPAPVVFMFLSQPKENVIVEWVNSPSEDVDHMELYRQIDDTGKVVLINTFDLTKKKQPTKYEDTYEFHGEKVKYFMYLYDHVGNVSISKTNTHMAKGERPGCIKDLKVIATIDDSRKEVELNWDVNSDDDIFKFVIYRQKDDGPMLDLALIRPNDLFYIDRRIAIGSTYKYIVRAFSHKRTCKALYSEPVVIEGYYK